MNTLLAALLCAAVMHSEATAQDKTKKPAPDKKKGDKKKPDKKDPVKKKPAPLPFKTSAENVSYGIGLDFGRRVQGTVLSPRGALARFPIKVDSKKFVNAVSITKDLYKNLRTQGLEIDEKRFREGFEAAFSKDKAKLDSEQMAKVFTMAREQMAAARKKVADKNKKDGVAFLKKNKAKKGVKTTKSGLQYIVLKAGKGKSPKADDLVVVHYKGTLLDGTEFDSSYKRKMPATFQVNRVIKGWVEALQLMKKGSKWKLFIPSDLAYGENGSGRSIGPNSVLTFEVELIDIKVTPKFDPKKKP